MQGIGERIGQLSEAKRKLLEVRLRGGTGGAAPTRHPASVSQRRLWFVGELLGPSSVYNSAHGIRFRGGLDVALLERALADLVRRHETLRMRFEAGADGPVGVVGDAFEIPLPVNDLQGLSVGDRRAEERRQAVSLARAPFDLGTGRLIRAALLRVADEEHLLVVVMHHIVSDRWSVGVLLRDLAALYDAARAGSRSTLPGLGMTYGQFANWQHARLRSAEMEPDRKYWRETLADLPPPLDLPADRPRPTVSSYAGATHAWALPKELTAAVEAVGRANGATPYMGFQAAFDVLLHRYTGRSDLVIGTPVAGRTRVECEGLIGLFVNVLPVRVAVGAGDSFVEVLGRVKARSLELLAHQQMPFDQLVEELKVPREMSRSPVFGVVFNFHNVPFEAAAPTGLSVELEEIDVGVSRFDLTFLMRPGGAGGMHCAIEYSTALFDRVTIERMAGHFETVLRGIVAEPMAPVGRLPLLTEAERRQILVEWSGAIAGREGEAPAEPGHARNTRLGGSLALPVECIHELFEREVERAPDAVAVVFGAERLTYRELNERANRLARHLRAAGVGPEGLVGICLGRSSEVVAAILAVWKAGAAYVPLDPAYPRGRLEAMLDEARPAVVIAEKATADAVPPGAGRRVVRLDLEAAEIAGQRSENLGAVAGRANLAYVIYTSGSTGRPKGVMIEHRGAVALAAWMREAFAEEHVRGVLLAASISFDMSVFELLAGLTRGGRLVLLNNVMELSEAPAAGEVTFMIAAPSAMTELVRTKGVPASVGAIVLGAEAVPAGLVLDCYALSGVERVYNLYGPTEDSIVSTGWVVPRDRDAAPSIGRPVRGTRAYVLDAAMQPVPAGVAGELYVGGVKLARGYLRREDLTRERFLPDPFDAAGRVYRTGDLCRWNADGTLRYLGRVDHQVKLRGFRIELEEIEAVLGRHPAVRQCLVMVRGEGAEKQLAAYVVADASVEALRRHAAALLPGYMVPGAIVTLDAMPLTSNGKIDRAALPAASGAGASVTGDAPRNEMERRLVEIWRELLGADGVGVHDSFFELGGHSLMAVRVVERIRQAFGKSVPLAKLFTSPTIAGLAEALGGGAEALWDDVIVPLRKAGRRPPLFCVPGIANEAFTFEPLSRRLDREQPLYALLLQGLASRGGVPTTVEGMAAAFVRHVREVAPEGPYRLGGYSFGGLVAHEMAVQLAEQGHRVELLVQFDSYAPAALLRRPLWRRMAMHLRKALGRGLGGGVGYLWRSLTRSDAPSLEEQAREVVAAGEGSSDATLVVRAACAKARVAHRPRKFSGRVTLFRVAEREAWREFLADDGDHGWQALAAGGVEIRDVDGGHMNLLQEPHVERLSRELNACLAIMEAAPSASPRAASYEPAA